MLIEGTCNTEKTLIIAKKYVELVRKGVARGEIFAIVLNPYKKAELITQICRLKPDEESEKHNVYTFFGLCYNAFNDNWEYISKLINAPSYSEKPNLCGLEVSQFIFKQSIKQADFSDYISKVNLLHQLFRRYSLIVQNNLSDEEVKKCSKLLGESFCDEAQKAIDDYKLKTIKYKSFDYLRQLAVLPLIYNHTDYFKNIKYLLIEDADEFSYAFWKFVDKIFPQLNDYTIAYDKNGSSRCGYLCAYKSGTADFIDKYSPKVLKLEDKTVFYAHAEEVYNKMSLGEKFKTLNIRHNKCVKRLDMFDDVFSYISELIKKGVKPSEISIITPLTDDVLVKSFSFPDINVQFQILSGSEKLIQNSVVSYILIIMKLAAKLALKDFELKNLLINLLKIPYKKCMEIVKGYAETSELINFDFEDNRYSYAYKKLTALISSLQKSKQTIQEQIQIIYSNIIEEFETGYSKEKYAFLLKEAESFEAAFNKEIKNLECEFIKQIENSVISENPADSFAIDKTAVIVSSPQKIIDYTLKTKHQIWLDISNGAWLKQDMGTLYNSWVFNRDLKQNEYNMVEDNIALTRDKTARMLRKLMLCSKENICVYSSLYDNTGCENFGGLDEYIETPIAKKPVFNIIPRADQKPVLDYKKGKMGIMAVPGAGKTTILLALIIKLLNDGIEPDNIFVLTYMESAAKNFKERLKSALPDNARLPYISTIHGLALRIIKENGNYSKAGLDEDFEICDDNTKEKIAKELFYRLKLDEDKFDNYLRCISIVKLSGFKDDLFSKFKEIQDFYGFFEDYNTELKQKNLIDYDDMLYFSLKILEENPEILKYYQNICRYIIEDEAQDSTQVQQHLIALLNSKFNNFVRCGDINQAITSTFTNSDLESFKSFINLNKKVEMVSSQRCAQPIYLLANTLVKEYKDTDAFYQIEMKGTQENPECRQKPNYCIFENEREEKSFIITKVKEILQNNPSASIAVLLRLNSQVNEYNELFMAQNIKTSVRTDCLSQKNIYKIIRMVLNVIQNPMSNKNISDLAKEYKQNGLYEFEEDEFDFIKSLKTPFIACNPDDIPYEGLLQLYWDIDYRLNNSAKEAYSLVLDIGLYYAKNTVDKSNSYMVSTLIKRLITENDSLDEIIKKLEYASQKPLSAYRFFEDEQNGINDSPVNIMTMHKSKGDEFDYVFIPEMNEDNYALNQENVKLKSGGHFVQTIKNSVEKTGIKSPQELKKEQINETLRLLYVGITRAKSGLYISSAKQSKRNKKIKLSGIMELIN